MASGEFRESRDIRQLRTNHDVDGDGFIVTLDEHMAPSLRKVEL